MTVAELARRVGRTMNDDLRNEFAEDMEAYTGQRPDVEYEHPASVPDGVARYWMNAFRHERSLVRVTRDRAWWRQNYTVCLSELQRAISTGDGVDVEHVLPLLPVLAEAAQLPELASLEAEMRLVAGRQATEEEREEAREAVAWIGKPPRDIIG